ncbi:MAG: transposase [Gammaproteobacteria bacterium]|nr:transposase [Gammaproteobacteria bacterium]
MAYLSLEHYQTLDQAYQGLAQYFVFYNDQRPHQALNYRTPAEVYADRQSRSL